MESKNMDIVPQDDIIEVEESRSREVTADRRREQFQMRMRGLKRREITPVLAEKYGVTEFTIDQDWSRRDSWVLDVVGVTDVTGLVASTIGGLALNQSFRRDILESLLRLADRMTPKGSDPLDQESIEAIEGLPFIWGNILKVLKDLDDSEKIKAEILLKLGILKEAPKKYIVDKRETRVDYTVDWAKIASNMDEEARRRLFDEIGALDIEYEEDKSGEED